MFKIPLPPKPTVLELIGRFALTPSEYHVVYDGHDPGDEDGRRPMFVCGLGARFCMLDPFHLGPHFWEIT